MKKVTLFTALKIVMLMVAMSVYVVLYSDTVAAQLENVVPNPFRSLLMPVMIYYPGWLCVKIARKALQRMSKMKCYFAGMTVNPIFDVPVAICWTDSVPDIESGFIFMPGMKNTEPWMLFRLEAGKIKSEIRFVNYKLYKSFVRKARRSKMDWSEAECGAFESLKSVFSMPNPRLITYRLDCTDPSEWPELGIPEPEKMEDAPEYREELHGILNRMPTLRRFDMLLELKKTIQARTAVQIQSESNRAVTRQLQELSKMFEIGG